jgi:hypothetical protein
MSITTYSQLRTAIADFLNRDDLAATVPTFIALAEADISRRLRHWQMEERATAEMDTQYSAVPADWVETIRFQTLGNGTRPLELISRAEMLDRRANARDAVGRPQFYTMAAGQFEVFPTPDQTYNAELLYFARVPALSDAAPTNWLLTAASDAYLYGALVHSAPYLQDDARSAVWASFYQSAIDALNTASDEARYSGSGLRMRIGAYK